MVRVATGKWGVIAQIWHLVNRHIWLIEVLISDVLLYLQWTLAYSNSFYMNAQIIQTACFNHNVIEITSFAGTAMPGVLYIASSILYTNKTATCIHAYNYV